MTNNDCTIRLTPRKLIFISLELDDSCLLGQLLLLPDQLGDHFRRGCVRVMFKHGYIEDQSSALLYLLNLLLGRLYLPAVGLDELVTIADSLFHVAQIALILVEALLNYVDSLDVVILAVLVLRPQVLQLPFLSLGLVKI